MSEQVHFRACPLCEALCGLAFHVEGGRLEAIRGDKDDPFSRGHICPKGNAILDLEQDPDRLRTPMRRSGSEWTPVSWEEALAEAGERLADIQRRHGDDAVAVYVGNPNVHHFGHLAYLPGLLRALRSKNVFSASTIDQMPHQLVNWAMYGHQFLLPVPDIDHTDFFLMLGANPLASNGSLMTVADVTNRIKALTRRGRLVVFDPRRSETAAAANEHHFIRPGSDVWFLIALLQAMQRTAPARIEAYAGTLQGLDDALAAVAAVDTGDLRARTGVSADTVARLAGEFLAAPRAVAYGRMGLSTQLHGSLCQWLLQLINLYSGNLDRVGGLLPNDAALPITGPGTSAGSRGRWHSRVRQLPEVMGELPVSTLIDELETPGPGQIRALFTCAGNPVLSTPAARRLDNALAGLEFMVSVDLYINETTRHAHLILPPASFLSQYHYDTVFNAFAVRWIARLNTPMQEQGDDERADWQILSGLAQRYAAAAGKPFQPLPPPRELIALGLARGSEGLDLATLEGAPHGIDLGPLRPSLLSRLQTADGRIACAPAFLLEALAALRAAPAPADDPDALLLIGRRHVRSNNSWMHNAARLVKGKPRHALWAHPDDLARRGIVAGSRVRVLSTEGQIDTEVEASEDLMPGVVSLPHGFGHGAAGTRMERANEVSGANYNVLSDPERIDGPSGNAAVNGLVVHLVALPEDALPTAPAASRGVATA